ncbi:MAG TPA: lysophospholipid acyltransferase family protein, partial [Opitutaceae bacterium]
FSAAQTAGVVEDGNALNIRPTKRAEHSKDKTIHTISGWRRWVLWPVTTLFGLWCRSIQFDLEPGSLEALRDPEHSTISVVWHNRLFLVPEIFRRFRQERPLYALVSASRDGAWLTDFFSSVGMRAVRGSSSRRGREAVTSLIEELRAGNDIGITPDGPRGPRYDFKHGAITVARRTRSPVVLIGVAYESAWELRSWDRFVVPKPFSRVRGYARLTPFPESKTDDELALYLRELMFAINPELDRSKPTVV